MRLPCSQRRTCGGRGAVAVGNLLRPTPANRYERLRVIPDPEVAPGCTRVDCTECFTGLLSIQKEAFFALGQFQDPTRGWPSWDDIAFGYRAVKAGLALIRTSHAQGIHHDESSASLQGTARRWQAASASAIRLFIRYPDLPHRFPFYRDKFPVHWGHDPWSLVARKLLRSLISCRPALEIVEHVADLFIRKGWPARLTRPLCGCVIGGHMWRGLRRGLALNGQLAAPGSDHTR